jgi:hypothetical protein
MQKSETSKKNSLILTSENDPVKLLTNRATDQSDLHSKHLPLCLIAALEIPSAFRSSYFDFANDAHYLF